MKSNSSIVSIPSAFAGLFEPHRFKVFYGGRGAGKSRSFARALLLIGTQRPIRVLCAREIQRSIRDSVKRLLDDEVARLDLGAFYASTDSEIRGANGTLFIFHGLRMNPEKIKSFEGLTHCWVEEAETVSARSLDLLVPTMRAPGSEIWLSFNPDRVTSPVWTRFVVQEPPPGSLVHKVSWRDNPWFPEELRREMEHCRATDPARWEHVWEGEPKLVAEGSYFGRLLRRAQDEGRLGRVAIDPALPVHTAWDLGIADSVAIWFFQYLPRRSRRAGEELSGKGKIQDGGKAGIPGAGPARATSPTHPGSPAATPAKPLSGGASGSFISTDLSPSGEWRFVDYYEASGEGLAHYAEILRQKGYRYGRHIGPHDIAVRELGSGRSRLESARALGISFTVAPRLSVADGIEAARQILTSAWFDKERCGRGLSALWAFQRDYDEVRACFRDAPRHDWSSHAADAFRYAAVGFREERPAFTPLRRGPSLRVC